MAIINPYLHFGDNTQEAFNFYKSVFGGEFAMVMKFSDVPEEYKSDPGEDNKIMHIALPIGQNVLMGSDTPNSMGGKPNAGDNFSVAASLDSREEADRVYKGLSAGGKETMPMADAFWGSYFGMLTDKFGINWMVSHDPQRS